MSVFTHKCQESFQFFIFFTYCIKQINKFLPLAHNYQVDTIKFNR